MGIPCCRCVLAVALLIGTGRAVGQQDNPVYVDDSPRAWELFLLAGDQAADNLGEAVRLYQELLDDYGMKLLPVNLTAPDHFVSVRTRVLVDLAGNETLLNRYRITETAEADRMLQRGHLDQLALTRALTAPGARGVASTGPGGPGVSSISLGARLAGRGTGSSRPR